MDADRIKRLVEESERLNDDEASEWGSVEALWAPYILQDDTEAKFRLAYFYLFGSFDEGPSKHLEMEKLLRTASDRNHPEAIYWLGHLYEEGEDRDQLLLRAAELGSLEAQRDLGALYATGHWTGPQDAARAADWYGRAAIRGHSDAQYNLGFMYLLGEGVEANAQEGLRWLHLSADQGNESSLRLLADVYKCGYYGVPIDATEAGRWEEKYRKSELYRMIKQAERDAGVGNSPT